MSETKRALLSVHDKQGIVPFARGLADLGFGIVSTGGTLKELAAAGVSARPVGEVTGVPEILGGRVKTLHPAIFGGILAQRQLSEDMTQLDEMGIARINVVAVNLYPFEKTIARAGISEPEAIEQIDIGGVSLLRAAGKNFRDVYGIVDPADYEDVLRAILDARDPGDRDFKKRLAAKVFAHCSAYDGKIAAYLEGPAGEGEAALAAPKRLFISLRATQPLRYGENPHQPAAFYADPACGPPSLAHCRQIQGKELSYNNYLDADGALELVREFEEPVCAILKHANPCGVGRGANPKEAYERALACDPVSAFGGIVGFNRPVDAAAAEAMAQLFLEVVIAPSFEPEAVRALASKKNLRLLETGPMSPRRATLSVRSVSGGILAQMTDAVAPDRAQMKVASAAQPTEADWDGLLFAWKVARWVRSNAIVYATAERTLGIGAGQMSRIDAANFGLQKAGGSAKGAYLASDGFFPFRDVVDLAAKAGVRAIIQPGGSIRDEESVAAANEHGITMVIAGHRHFRH